MKLVTVFEIVKISTATEATPTFAVGKETHMDDKTLTLIEESIDLLENPGNNVDADRIICIYDIAEAGGLVTLGRARNFSGVDVPMASVKVGGINQSAYGTKDESIWDVLLTTLRCSIRRVKVSREFENMARDLWGSGRVVNHGETMRGDGECIEIVMGELRFTTLPYNNEVWGELRGHRITKEPVMCDDLRGMVSYIGNVVSNTNMENKGA
jgi:hypothetical protein